VQTRHPSWEAMSVGCVQPATRAVRSVFGQVSEGKQQDMRASFAG